MVKAWEIRGWSLKVREEPLSTGSSQNESCYLILLSTLLRFIRQLFDALQYAANRAGVVLPFPLSGIPSCLHSPFLFHSLPFPLQRIHIKHMCARIYSFVYTHTILSLSRGQLLPQIFLLKLFYKYNTIVVAILTNKILTSNLIILFLVSIIQLYLTFLNNFDMYELILN